MPGPPYNPVEIILEEEHQCETIQVGRLIDLAGTQYRYIINDQKLKEGKRYDIDPQRLEENLLWIEDAWATELLLPNNDRG